ncbi:lysophospholipid acyltransferase family protein [Radicibacter daui]|uniref:lysophospholipid acyltransferase family protein n=1 Tax=Radicibacter daui TaxID=3064829 RepID=UPI004046F2AD
MTISTDSNPQQSTLSDPAPVAGSREASPAEQSGLPNGSLWRGVPRLAFFLLMSPVLIVCGLLAEKRRKRGIDLWTQRYCRIVLWLLGVHVVTEGVPEARRPTLIVSNHISYFDILAMETVTPLVFVAKSEVEGWPVFGWMARIARTVFIDRRPAAAREQTELLGSHIKAGERLVVFPEGTSSDGTGVLPFKSSLFALAEAVGRDGSLLVQPVSVVYERLADGRPIVEQLTGLYGWYADMDFFPHLLRAFRLPGATVRIIFHPSLEANGYEGGRKRLAADCEAMVRGGLERSRATLQ